MKDWLRLAFQGSVVRRGLLYAVVVGSVLIGINHGDAILRGDVDGGRLQRITLTVLVPYLVSTSSSVAAIRALRRSQEVLLPRKPVNLASALATPAAGGRRPTSADEGGNR